MKYQHTRHALAGYDAGRDTREQAWQMAQTAGAVRQAARSDLLAALVVSEAFFKDTRGLNQLDRCQLVHPDDPWLRKLIND
jgi:hypothetical protein